MSETCRVLFQKIKFEKLVHVVGFSIRIYHDARSLECQSLKLIVIFKFHIDFLLYISYIFIFCILKS